MKLTFIGSESDDGKSPTVYSTDRGTFVVQGWKITDAMVRTQARNLPDHEDLVEIPLALIRHFPKQV